MAVITKRNNHPPEKKCFLFKCFPFSLQARARTNERYCFVRYLTVSGSWTSPSVKFKHRPNRRSKNSLSMPFFNIFHLSPGFELPQTENKCLFSYTFFSVIMATNETFYYSQVGTRQFHCQKYPSLHVDPRVCFNSNPIEGKDKVYL